MIRAGRRRTGHRVDKEAWTSRSPHDLVEVYHFVTAGVGLAAGVLLGALVPAWPDRVVGAAASIVAGVTASVIASLAILGSLLDDAFLIRMGRVGRHPLQYMGPLIVTAVFGVAASLSLLVASSVPSTAPSWLRLPTAAFAGAATILTIASLVPDLKVLNSLVRLRAEVVSATDRWEPAPRADPSPGADDAS